MKDNYCWQNINIGEWVLTKDMHIIGGITELTDKTQMYWVNIADEFEISLGAKNSFAKAQNALIKFLAIE